MPNPWDAIWVSTTSSKEIVTEYCETLQEFVDVLQRANEGLEEAKQNAEAGIDPESFYLREDIRGHDDGDVHVSVYLCRDLTREEIEKEKKEVWEDQKKRREEHERREYLRLKEKFKDLDQNVL